MPTFSPKVTVIAGWHPSQGNPFGGKLFPDEHFRMFSNGMWGRVYRSGECWRWSVSTSPWNADEVMSGIAPHCSTAMIRANIAAW